jgi:hypothetical protein
LVDGVAKSDERLQHPADWLLVVKALNDGVRPAQRNSNAYPLESLSSQNATKSVART